MDKSIDQLKQDIKTLEQALEEAEGRAYEHLKAELEELQFILEAHDV